jgi:hypothetical protein
MSYPLTKVPGFERLLAEAARTPRESIDHDADIEPRQHWGLTFFSGECRGDPVVNLTVVIGNNPAITGEISFEEYAAVVDKLCVEHEVKFRYKMRTNGTVTYTLPKWLLDKAAKMVKASALSKAAELV